MRWPLVVLAVCLASLHALADGSPDCHGHGDVAVSGDACNCTSPWPSGTSSGYVGDACSIEVKPLTLDGSEVSHTLQPGEHFCWAVNASGLPHAPNFFTALLVLAAGSTGRVSVRGLLREPLPDGQTCDCALGLLYPNRSAAWDGLMSVGPDSPQASLHLGSSGAAVQRLQRAGLYLCAGSAGDAPVAFSLRAAAHGCPLRLHDNGCVSLCSSTPEDVRYASDTCPGGVCTCLAAYARPASPVAPGLGFEECSAQVQPWQAHTVDARGNTSLIQVGAADANSWVYANFTVAEADTFVWLAAESTTDTPSRLGLYLRAGQPPGAAPGQFSVRTSWTDFSGDRALTASLSKATDAAWAPGLWWVGVQVQGDAAASFTLRLRQGRCPGATQDCSGRGACDATTGACSCAQAAFTGLDCANAAQQLALGVPLLQPARAFTQDALSVSGLQGKLALPTVSLVVTASFTTPQDLPPWVTARPQLLLSGARPPSAADRWQPSAGPAPTALWLPEPGQLQQLSLDHTQVPGDTLYISFLNPLSAPFELGYNVTVALAAQCLEDCNGHGSCDAAGQCVCADGWAGLSCSVDMSGAGGRCTPGSRLPRHLDEQRVTCWAACDADSGTYRADGCADFTCDPTAADGRAQRRQGAAQACVVDECEAGQHTVQDESGAFVCDRRCACPEDGGGCALDLGCLPGTMRCLKGLVLVNASDGTQQCVAGSEGSCQEGALLPSPSPVEGGTRLAVCVCASSAAPPAIAAPGTAASSRAAHQPAISAQQEQLQRPGQQPVHEDGPVMCSFTEPSQDMSQGLLLCGPGYELHDAQPGGITLSDGRQLASGGRCTRAVPSRRGTGPGGVFFWCVFSVALAAGSVLAGRRAVDWWEENRYDLGSRFGDRGSGLLTPLQLGWDSFKFYVARGLGLRGAGESSGFSATEVSYDRW